MLSLAVSNEHINGKGFDYSSNEPNLISNLTSIVSVKTKNENGLFCNLTNNAIHGATNAMVTKYN